MPQDRNGQSFLHLQTNISSLPIYQTLFYLITPFFTHKTNMSTPTDFVDYYLGTLSLGSRQRHPLIRSEEQSVRSSISYSIQTPKTPLCTKNASSYERSSTSSATKLVDASMTLTTKSPWNLEASLHTVGGYAQVSQKSGHTSSCYFALSGRVGWPLSINVAISASIFSQTHCFIL